MAGHPKLQIGTTLGERYELTEQIGEGGFGKIYRGRQLNIDRDVAVKVLPPKFADVENVVSRFRREARLASRLHHPNTITIHDYGRQDDFFFIVMEYLEGQDLARRLAQRSQLSLDVALHIATQTLKSLREAHQFGIVHRDLKPENIFLTEMDGDPDYVKVLDFGIAKLADHDPDWLDVTDDSGRNLTVQGNTVGTPAYMSPEQAAGEDVDATSDLYTVGLILFEMVNGRPPFEKERPVQTMRAQLFDPVPSFFNENLRNTRFESIVRTALAKDPDDRFADADEFLDALDDPELTARSLGAVALSADGSTSSKTEPQFPSQSGDSDGKHGKGGEPQRDSTDEVPFEVVPEHRSRDRHSPSTPVTTDGKSVSSSIITVVDEPDDDEVIVLTNKKESGDDGEDTSPDRSTDSRDTGFSDDLDQSPESPAQPSEPADNTAGGDDEEWGWHDGAGTAKPDGSSLLVDFDGARRRRRILLAVAVIIVVAAATIVGLVANDVVPLPL